jgi:predicted metal-dependent hydrolase
MPTEIDLGGIVVEVVRKGIKNVHLSVYPPTGRVRIAAPERMKLDTIRAFAITKLVWIKQQRRRMQGQPRESSREYVDRESHFLWGRRYLLRVVEREGPPEVRLTPRWIELHIGAGVGVARRHTVLEQWYREQLRAVAEPHMARWERRLGVKAQRLYIQSMKTRWGSCTPDAGNIRLNTELAKKPPSCVEYIVVHELAHLIERSHGPAFVAILDRHMPNWRERRVTLNAAPLGHRDWAY